MSKSTKGKSPVNPAGRNPIKSASPYETPGVGECCPPQGAGLKKAPVADPVTDDDVTSEA